MLTYQDIIRSYSNNVANGTSDGDLDQYTRTLVSFMLNTASNAPVAQNRYYGTDRDDTLTLTRKHLADVLWDSSHLIRAAAGKRAGYYDIAVDRAFAILTNI